jgi:Tol biopolymer transport system component
MRLDTGHMRTLVHLGTSCEVLGSDWAPNGKRIVFASENDDGLLTIRPDGTHLRRLTTNTNGDYEPNYTANGRSIIFQRELADESRMMRVAARGGHLRPVRGAEDASWPAPAPEGGCVAVSGLNGLSEIGRRCPEQGSIADMYVSGLSWQPRP